MVRHHSHAVKRYAVINAGFLLLCGLLSPVRAQQNDIWTDAQVQAYFGTTWDWRTEDLSQWVGYYGARILVPWIIDHAGGIPVSGTDMPQPTRGWRLYEKHLSCVDYGQPQSCLTGLPGTILPHFSLYNIYTGTLRTFVFLDVPQQDDERVLLATDAVTAGSQGGPSDYGLFLNVGDLAGTLATTSNARNEGYSGLVRALYGKWVVVDREISYDPFPIPNDLVFQYSVWGVRQERIELSGELTERAIDTEHPLDDPYAELNFVIGAGGTIIKNLAGAASFATDMRKREQELRAHHYDGLADASLAMADLTARVGIPATLIVSGLQIVSAFTKTFLGGPSVQYTPKTMTV